MNAPTKSLLLVLLFVLAFVSFVTIACDSNPCADGTACGITAPRDDNGLMQTIINEVERTDPQGDSNNW